MTAAEGHRQLVDSSEHYPFVFDPLFAFFDVVMVMLASVLTFIFFQLLVVGIVFSILLFANVIFIYLGLRARRLNRQKQSSKHVSNQVFEESDK